LPRERLLKKYLRTRFVVTLTTGETFSGLLDEHDATHIVLVDATTLYADRAAEKIAGQLFLQRDRVAYMQLPDGRA
jgi:hypothetical protein